MTSGTEGVISILAAIFIMFTALLDPRVSAGLAVLFLVALGIHKLVGRR